MSVSLIWTTPGGDDLIAMMARVSNPDNQDNKKTAPKLIKYLIDHKHWSPFEMVNACVKIETSRDIAHQIIRHRSFAIQEYSGRYAEYGGLLEREGRLQDHKNRQNSLPCEDESLRETFSSYVREVGEHSFDAYRGLIDLGFAKESARALLPEGLVPTTMYMNGSIRSWIHYWGVRCTPDTQKEHRLIAYETRDIILKEFPQVALAGDPWPHAWKPQ